MDSTKTMAAMLASVDVPDDRSTIGSAGDLSPRLGLPAFVAGFMFAQLATAMAKSGRD